MSKLYPLRERISYMIPWRVKKVWDAIRFWTFPRQGWLLEKIPDQWIDKDTLWEICILEGITHYVEQDNGLGKKMDRTDQIPWFPDFEKSQVDPEYPEHQKEFDILVLYHYKLITEKLPILERQLKEAWAKVPKRDLDNLNIGVPDYDATYGEVDRLEKDIADLKTEVMVWAVKNRESIWT